MAKIHIEYEDDTNKWMWHPMKVFTGPYTDDLKDEAYLWVSENRRYHTRGRRKWRLRIQTNTRNNIQPIPLI
jgi:hypothetical protein